MCENCNHKYDDAYRWTICPHNLLMPIEDLRRKDLAIKLIGRKVRFHHEKNDVFHRVTAVNYIGMISIEGFVGEFDPSLFKIVDS